MKTNFEQSLKQSKIFNRITQFREIILYDYYQKKKTSSANLFEQFNFAKTYCSI